MGFGQLAGAQRRLLCIFTDMILVTGGTGLVGGHLLYRFRESETPIHAIYRTEDSIDKTITKHFYITWGLALFSIWPYMALLIYQYQYIVISMNQ